MKTIRWITQASGNKFQRFSQSLGVRGYSIEWVEIPPPPFSVEWLGQHVPSDTVAVFLSVTDTKWISDLILAIRALPVPQLRFLPIIWIAEGKSDEVVSAIAETGVDDIFFLDASIADITLRLNLRRKEAEQWMKFDLQQKEQVMKIAKTETTLKQREEFLSVCAHDLRSPLGIIQASLSMMLHGTPNHPPPGSAFHVDLLTRAKRQATHAMALVKDLLDVMAFEQGFKPHYQFLNLHDLLTEFYTDYGLQAEQKEVRFHYDNSIKEWRILADADRVRQLLQNLFTNALKFTDKGKNIYLKVAPFTGRRKTDPPFPMIIISLKDEGRGIPQNELQKIFDRFSQIKGYSRADGRGLGLTVAKQISTLHGGNIWVESVEGVGSTFFVLFPDVISRTTKPPADPNRRLLIADPNVGRREVLSKEAKIWGHELVFAKDGVEALTLLFHLMPDALILTPGLAKMDEVEVANIVRAEGITSHIPVLMALEEIGQQKKYEDMLFDQTLKLPLTKPQVQGALDLAMNQVRPIKKVA